MTHLDTFDGVYRRLEEVMLANSGENEFEEIFKLVLLALWEELHPAGAPDTVEQANRRLAAIDSSWPGVLTEVRLRLTQEQYTVCRAVLEGYSFLAEGYEGVDGIFELIVSREKKGTKGQFFTPRYLVDFCVDLLHPRAHESILDPAAGSGAFLYHCALREGVAGGDLWGFDFDATAVRVARLLMAVGGVEGVHLHKVNSLLTGRARAAGPTQAPGATIEDLLRMEKKRDRFDVIVTNPPFAGEIVEPDLLEQYQVSRGKSRVERDVLFVERCVNLLRPGGRMAILLPDNIFGGRDNEGLRRWLYDTCRVAGVVGIPRNAFMPHTPIKTSILFLQKRDRPRVGSESIFFGISERSGKDSRGNLRFREGEGRTWRNVDHDLAGIAGPFRAFLRREGMDW